MKAAAAPIPTIMKPVATSSSLPATDSWGEVNRAFKAEVG